MDGYGLTGPLPTFGIQDLEQIEALITQKAVSIMGREISRTLPLMTQGFDSLQGMQLLEDIGSSTVPPPIKF
jgi:hypothetical protein